MKLQFHLHYHTVFGEDLLLNVVGVQSTGDTSTVTYRMATHDGAHWSYEMTLKNDHQLEALSYYYSVETDGAITRKEWGIATHRLDLNLAKAAYYHIYDQWINMPQEAHLYTSAFTDCLSQVRTRALPSTDFSQTVRLIVRAPQLKVGDTLCIIGQSAHLGAWNAAHALAMTQIQPHEWAIDLDATLFYGEELEFKFVARSLSDTSDTSWEENPNRRLTLPNLMSHEVLVYALSPCKFKASNCRMAGTLVPVFSLRTKGSFGVGDFGDLKAMIDFMDLTKQRVLQILPINDTTSTHSWKDSYPYSCISIFALHPQYCDLRQLPPLKNKAQKAKFNALQKELNALPSLDYERVNAAKLRYLRLIFDQEGSKVLASDAFQQFFKHAESWLVPYAYFCHLRDSYQEANFARWRSNKQWDEAQRKKLTSPRNKLYKEVAFYYFVQFQLHTQLVAAHRHARQKRVILKGDIPIGVSRYGCDVWMEPNYFNMNGQAGAPPDDFSANGQNWGFPTYNWQEMLKDDCAWWVRRFRHMAEFFDAYRIDHVLGFFRIWEIPITAVHGLTGQFAPALGLSREEISAYGFNFQEKLFTTPFIRSWVIERLFKERAAEVKQNYLQEIENDTYALKADFDTERKIEAYFSDKTSEDDKSLRDRLYALVSNVLFVRDRLNPSLFHPRIAAHSSTVYESLWDVDKHAFNKLYNDYYYHRNNQYWYHEAMKKLPKMTEATRMLVCAEDLGMVPESVSWVMHALRILSLEVQSMPKDPSLRFGDVTRNPYLSVDTISSHDMPTLRQWWDEDQARTQTFYNSILHQNGAAPHPLPDWLASDILAQHLQSPSMLCILALQDWLAIDAQARLADADAERINIPANPTHYWRYRMHLNIEDLHHNEALKERIATLIEKSGRAV